MNSTIEVGGTLLTQHAASHGWPFITCNSHWAIIGAESPGSVGGEGGAEITGWRLGVAPLHNDRVGPVGPAKSTTFPAPTHIWGGHSYSCHAR